ncbi:hypothetical protein [Pseudomonas sp. 21LCFQ010]|uniref:hypothetical protein n=1 Tax=Pseudomonas sp. 21LCFQ010 TaxID=2957506 RepID=UPI002096849C|nr:hypothetical protein [Pseudomonas sp. 21LCFQ010]
MIDAALRGDPALVDPRSIVEHDYQQMLAAAPQPPALGVESVQRFWAEEAQNIRCVRESDFDEQIARLQAELARSNAEVERLTALHDVDTEAMRRMLARNAELEGLLRKQAEHIVILAENTLSYSSGIGSPIKTKEVNDAVYVALMHQQAVNAALASGKCCQPTAEELAALQAGDCTPEELWGGGRPNCPKCHDSKALAEGKEQ